MFKKFIRFNKSICKKLETKFPNFFGDPDNYNDDLKKLIDNYINDKLPKNILEVGGANRPILKKSKHYVLFGLDIDDNSENYKIYDFFLLQPIEKKLNQKFDMIISKTLLEHLPNNEKSLLTIYNGLNHDGVTMHYVPNKYHFYSVILRIIGPKLQKILIHHLRPEAETVTGFPAFFDNCSPNQMKKLLQNIGFKDIKIKTYFRATDYFAFFVPIFIIVATIENFFKYFGLNTFSSGMIFIAKKKD